MLVLFITSDIALLPLLVLLSSLSVTSLVTTDVLANVAPDSIVRFRFFSYLLAIIVLVPPTDR